MPVNPQMHPRNKYKSPPDFMELAIKYPAFREVASIDLDGKVKVDFKSEKTLRVLTKHLLKADFNLDVAIPENYLVPTLPLRLNYVLWLEDICSTLKITQPVGVDIGCGAVCIYPILAATKNKWKMHAVETNMESIKYATQNIVINHLESLITIHHQPNQLHLLSDIATLNTSQESIDFCMCNPPFFSSTDDLDNNNRVNRTGRRHPPKTTVTGNTGELVQHGGEVAFIKRLIDESLQLKDKVKVFTTMLGHKNSVDTLINFLRADNITNYTQTEFCQGNTTRWGLAWTHRWDFLLRRVPVYGSKATLEVHKGFTYVVPDNVGNFENVLISLEAVFQELKLQILEKYTESGSATFIVYAYENTWSNQRKKRRELKRLLENSRESIEDNNSLCNKKFKKDNGDNQFNKVDVKSVERVPILVTSVEVRVLNNKFVIELVYINGRAAKDGVHQVLQFIINKWKGS